MATFVLVPGGWLGAWAWAPLAERLRAAGHRVHPITLTGLGDRSHLELQGGFTTHVEDVLATLRYEGIDDVTLLGHSYGGVVISAVAERSASSLRQLVFLDALVPLDGETGSDALRATGELGELLAGAIDADAAARGDGRFGYMPPVDAWLLGAHVEWFRERVVPHPYDTQLHAVRLADAAAAALPRHYVLCMEALRPMADRARVAGAAVHELVTRADGTPVGHYPMATAVDELATLLSSLVP